MQRKFYLEDIPLDEAIARFYGALEENGGLRPLPGENIPLDQALGRVTSEPVWARMSSPHYHSAAMDGVAVRAHDTHGASRTSPLTLRLGEQARWIDTGDPIPVGLQRCHYGRGTSSRRATTRLRSWPPLPTGSHVRLLGEDMVRDGACVAGKPQDWPVRPGSYGRRRPDRGRGSPEARRLHHPNPALSFITPGEPMEVGKIIEFNSLMMAAQVEEWGGRPVRHPIVPDDFCPKSRRRCSVRWRPRTW